MSTWQMFWLAVAMQCNRQFPVPIARIAEAILVAKQSVMTDADFEEECWRA